MTRTFRSRRARKGNILVLTAFLMIGMMAMLAMAIDVGYLYIARSQAQRAADAAAIAAALELTADMTQVDPDDVNLTLTNDARGEADEYAQLNTIFQDAPELSSDDVEVGYMQDHTDPNASIDQNSSERPMRCGCESSERLNKTAKCPCSSLAFWAWIGWRFEPKQRRC